MQSAARPDNVNCSAAASRRHAAGATLPLHTGKSWGRRIHAQLIQRRISDTEYDIRESAGHNLQQSSTAAIDGLDLSIHQYLSRAHRIFAVSVFALDPGWIGYLCGIISQLTVFISSFSSSPHTAACHRMALGTMQHDTIVFAHRKNPLWPCMGNFLVSGHVRIVR